MNRSVGSGALLIVPIVAGIGLSQGKRILKPYAKKMVAAKPAFQKGTPTCWRLRYDERPRARRDRRARQARASRPPQPLPGGMT